MRTFKNAVVLASVLLLAACGGGGESKVTKIDGTSNATAQRSLDKMIKTMPDNASIQWQNDVAMLKSRYPEGDEFAKQFGGKTLDELKPAIAEAKAHYIKFNRDRNAAEVQADIDELKVKLESFQGSPESNTRNIMIAQTEAKMAARTKARDAILAMNDDQAWAEFGCGCQEVKFKESGKF